MIIVTGSAANEQKGWDSCATKLSPDLIILVFRKRVATTALESGKMYTTNNYIDCSRFLLTIKTSCWKRQAFASFVYHFISNLICSYACGMVTMELNLTNQRKNIFRCSSIFALLAFWELQKPIRETYYVMFYILKSCY